MSLENINLIYEELVVNDTSIVVKDMSLTIGTRHFLENTNLTINRGNNYGIISPNGHGKTTLLRCIHDAFGIENMSVYMVKQEDMKSDLSVYDEVLSSHADYQEFVRKEKELEDYDGEDQAEKYEELYDWSNSLGLNSIEAKAHKVLFGIGFDSDMQKRKVSDYSGGWIMRVSIAKALLNEPDLLIMDEPTNHLDLDAVIWLNNHFQNWNDPRKGSRKKNKTLLLVSHDVNFLDNVCNKIVAIHKLKIKQYNCNYEKMLKMRNQERVAEEREWDKKKKKIKSKKQRKKERPSKIYEVGFSFDNYCDPQTSISLDDVSFAYPDCDYTLEDIDFSVSAGEKIVIIGKNGSGKSTLLKLLTGELEPTDGDVFHTKKVRIGRYYQHFEDTLPMEKTPVEYLQSLTTDKSITDIRKHLSKFNLEGSAHTIPISQCSGGQKSRIAFASMALSNMLVLDEPTNHLDIETITGLTEALKSYSGGLVVVTHDERLIRELECQIYVCADGEVTKYRGDFDDYVDELMGTFEDEEN